MDAWWSDRTAELARREWLASLREDFAANATEAQSYADRSAADRALVQQFVLMSAEEAARVPEDSVWVYLRAVWRPNPAPLNTPAIVAALEAAPVLASEDHDLRLAIGTWRSEVSYLAQFDTRLWETQDQAFTSIIDHPAVRRAIAQEEPGIGHEDMHPTLPTTVLVSARADEDFMRLAAKKARYAAQQLRFLRNVATASENVRAAASVAMAR